MLKKPTGTAGNLGTFLQADDLKPGEQELTILGVRPAPPEMEYSQYLLDVQNGKRKFVLGLKEDASSYKLLTDAFGLDESKWIGKKIVVRPRYTKKYENGFVDVVEAIK